MVALELYGKRSGPNHDEVSLARERRPEAAKKAAGGEMQTLSETMERRALIGTSRQRGSWRALWVSLMLSLSLMVSSVAFASNYYLSDLGRFEAAQLEVFDKNGIETTEQFLAQSLTSRARKALASRLKMSEAAVEEFARECEFLQITGVGPKAAALLRASGVSDVKALASEDPSVLLTAIKKTNAEKRITETNPTLSVVQHWITEAGKVPYHIK